MSLSCCASHTPAHRFLKVGVGVHAHACMYLKKKERKTGRKKGVFVGFDVSGVQCFFMLKSASICQTHQLNTPSLARVVGQSGTKCFIPVLEELMECQTPFDCFSMWFKSAHLNGVSLACKKKYCFRGSKFSLTKKKFSCRFKSYLAAPIYVVPNSVP